MTLEQEVFKARGGFGQRPLTPSRPPGALDWFARFLALLILLAFLSAALYVLATFVPIAFLASLALLWILLAHLASRTRELSRRLVALEAKVESSNPRPPSAAMPPSGGAGGE